MPLVLDTTPQPLQDCHLFCSRPNRSLTPAGRTRVFWSIAAVTLIIACTFGGLGYWPILPFAGLEIGVLAWAFETLARRADDFESIRICGDEILIEHMHEGRLKRRTLPCKWAKLVLEAGRPGGKVRLAMRAHGRETEVGVYLTDEARLELAKALQTRIDAG